MAKEKKQDGQQKNKGRTHNPKTRYYNSRRKGVKWGEANRTVGKGKNKRDIVVDVVIPYDKQWDPALFDKPAVDKLSFPYDTLLLDWMEETIHYALNNNSKVKKHWNEKTLLYTYSVINRDGKKLFEVITPRNIMYNMKLRRHQ